ncbi:MAG: hypothetical protein U0T84_01530 [Chitinophagales bacterium]
MKRLASWLKFTAWGMLAVIAILFSSCKKCKYCENSCKVCTDAHYRITVCSDRLSADYYKLYIDSLTSPGLGWSCQDTTPDRGEQVCATRNFDSQITWKEASGYTCRSVD